MERNATIICTAANRVAANALAQSLGLGPNCFSVPRALTAGLTDPALASHYVGTGYMNSDALDQMSLSLDPAINVLDMGEGQTFETHMGMVTTNGVVTPLHPINEPI